MSQHSLATLLFCSTGVDCQVTKVTKRPAGPLHGASFEPACFFSRATLVRGLESKCFGAECS